MFFIYIIYRYTYNYLFDLENRGVENNFSLLISDVLN